MVILQENKTYFVSYRLHLPHGVGEEHTATLCQINYVNINGVKWKLKNAPYLKFLYITDIVLLVRYRTNGWSQFIECSDCKVGLCKKSCFKLFHT